MRLTARAAAAAVLAGVLGAAPAAALDAASLQFTVPAPDPVQAGETLALQALAVNTGDAQWTAGSYYWVGEVYDLDYKLAARTTQISPRENVAPGGVAAISLPFNVPETAFGRRLYRVFLVVNNKTLLQSEYKGFSIIEKPIPPPPEVVSYHIEGNVTVSVRDTSRNKWKDATGTTNFNTVGKLKQSSYLVNMYVLHKRGNVFDPVIIQANYYAPWGTVYGGDIQPSLGPLAVSGQGMRGLMLEQKKGKVDWNLLGGQTVESQAGTAQTNGRYARSLYAGKLGLQLFEPLKVNANYFLSADEVGSLSSDPRSNNFRGPNLAAQKNSGYGLDFLLEPAHRLKLVAAWQNNTYHADLRNPAVKDTAIRGEASFERALGKVRLYMQRAGADFVAFGNPGIVGDRLTYNLAVNLYPAKWYSFSLMGDQFKDNLRNDPRRTTTTQRVVSMGHSLQLPSRTSVSLSASLNTAKGQPSTALNNRTTTMGLSVGQVLGKHSVSLSGQSSQFRDANKLAHDLDTQTIGFSSSWRLPRSWSANFGATVSNTKDKSDGSKRTSQTVGPGLSVPLNRRWTSQYWGSYTATKNTSTTAPADNKLLSVNSEYTLTASPQVGMTFGVGGNQSKDKINKANEYKELVLSMRYSYSF
jgi:hypothetical protein